MEKTLLANQMLTPYPGICRASAQLHVTMSVDRNIYKEDVNFSVLALQDPEFNKLCVP